MTKQAKQNTVIVVIAFAAWVLGQLGGAPRAQASDPVTRDDVQRVVRALERIADVKERCR